MDYTNIPCRNWSSLQHSQVSKNNGQERTSSMYNTNTQVHPSSNFTYERPSTAYTFSASHVSSPEELARWYERRFQELTSTPVAAHDQSEREDNGIGTSLNSQEVDRELCWSMCGFSYQELAWPGLEVGNSLSPETMNDSSYILSQPEKCIHQNPTYPPSPHSSPSPSNICAVRYTSNPTVFVFQCTSPQGCKKAFGSWSDFKRHYSRLHSEAGIKD